jgi:4-amino-4-deoxy-L-arabinose transferase-like glycosyltransferase
LLTRRFIYPALAIVCAAPRLGVLLHERGAILASYTEKSDTFALTFVKSGTFGFIPGIPSADTQPLYGWFLVPVYWIFGRSWESVGLAQLVLAIATVWLVWEIGKRFLSVHAAIAGAVIATLNPYLVWHDMHVNREIADQVVLAALVLVTIMLAQKPSLELALLDGILLGLAILGNTRLFALPLVVAAWLAARIRRRAAIALIAAAFAFAGLTVLPWLVRNKIQVGCYALTTDGRAFWKANNRFTYGVLSHGGWIDDVPTTQPPGRPPTPEEAWGTWMSTGQKTKVDECAQPGYYESKVFSFWVDHPSEKGKLMEQASSMLWSPFVTETSGRSGAGTSLDVGRRVIAPAYMIGVYALAAVGAFLAPIWLVVLTGLLLAYNTVAALAFAGATRYRVAFDFLLALLAGTAITYRRHLNR